jgi:hypothetical protein
MDAVRDEGIHKHAHRAGRSRGRTLSLRVDSKPMSADSELKLRRTLHRVLAELVQQHLRGRQEKRP